MTEALRASNVPEIERYELGSLIGRGSMGAVYEATDADGRVVALKILHPEVAEHEMAVTRFEREVSLARRIEHPAVPEIFDWGQLPDGRLFLAMERLHGESLEAWWDTPGRSRATAMELLLEALGPLAAAHRLGIVHRDLKPENVFVLDRPDERGRVRLLDFGIARHLDADAKAKTATGVAVGTPVYMSPEQATKPRLASHPTDVWSFGVMMYEALCGELPFDGDTPHAVIIAVATEAHVPIADRAPGVHPELLALVERCLQKDPSRRPKDAGELETIFGALLARPEVVATLDGYAATPSYRPSALPTGEAAPFELRRDRQAGTLEESATPSSSGLRRIEPPRRRWISFAAVAALALGAVGVWAWSRDDVASRAPESGAPAVSAPTSERDEIATGPSTEEPPPMEQTPTEENEERRSSFDDEPGPAPEVSVRRPVAPRESTRETTRADAPRANDVARDEVAAAEAAREAAREEAASLAPTTDATTTPRPVSPSATAAEPSAAEPAPATVAATADSTEPSAAEPSAMEPSANEPRTPMTRTVRRVVRRPATKAPTRPGFVTF